MKTVRIISLLAVLCMAAAPVRAQRQTPGRPSMDGYVTLANTQRGFGLAGGGFAWCNYDYGGRTSLGVDVFLDIQTLSEEAVYDSYGELVFPEENYTFGSYDVCAAGGYFFRLLAPRSRVFILSAGGTLLVGAKYCKPVSGFYKDGGDKKYSPVGFLLGMVPEVQAELFPFRNVSLYVAARPRVEFLCGLGGHSEWFKMSYAGGLKIYL